MRKVRRPKPSADERLLNERPKRMKVIGLAHSRRAGFARIAGVNSTRFGHRPAVDLRTHNSRHVRGRSTLRGRCRRCTRAGRENVMRSDRRASASMVSSVLCGTGIHLRASSNESWKRRGCVQSRRIHATPFCVRPNS